MSLTSDAATLQTNLSTVLTGIASVVADAQAAMSGASTNKRSAMGAFILDMQGLQADLGAAVRSHNLSIAAALDAAS
jgi:hypothetical protein